jgi:hypothetical protein
VTIAWLGSSSSSIHGRRPAETMPAGADGARRLETTAPAGLGGVLPGGGGAAGGRRRAAGGGAAGRGAGDSPTNALAPAAA